MIFIALFVILFGLACWGVIYARGKWPLKLAAIVAIPLIALGMHSALGSYEGYPTKKQPPNVSQYVSCLVVEPTRIYLWLIPLKESKGFLEYKSDAGEPRAFSLPYTRSLHQTCAKADKAQQGGQGPIGLRLSEEGASSARASKRYVPYLLPPVHLPPKEKTQ